MSLKKTWETLGLHHKTVERLVNEKLTPEALKDKNPQEILELGFSEAGAKSIYDALHRPAEAQPAEAAVEEPKAEPKPKAEKPKAEKAEKKEKKKEEKDKADVDDPRTLPLKDRLKAIETLVEKSGGTIRIASEMKELDYGKMSTGHAALDAIMANPGEQGGWPKGKYSLIFGAAQTSKTGTCLDTIAKDQKADPNSIWVWADAENSFDKPWAVKLGVDLSRLVIIPAGIADDMFTDIEAVIRKIAPTGVVVDSIGGLLSWQEVMKDREDKTFTKEISADTMALTARFLNKFYRRFLSLVAKFQTTFILITHVYAAIGDRFATEVAKGGNGMQHFSHVMLRTDRRKGDKEKKQKLKMPDGREIDVFVAYEVVFTVYKTRQSGTEGHKVAIPFVFGKGLSEVESVLEMAFALGVIQQSGSWYYHASLVPFVDPKDNGWVNGRPKTLDLIREHPEVVGAILEDVGTKMVEKIGAEAQPVA